MIGKTIDEFIAELGSRVPVPGGGSVAALNLSLAGALLEMVINLSLNKKGLEEFTGPLNNFLVSVSAITREAKGEIKKDGEAFTALMELYKSGEKESEKKDKALISAAAPGMSVIENSLALAGYALQLLPISNKQVISDIGVSVANIRAAAQSAFANVLINIKNVSDAELRQSMGDKSRALLNDIEQLCNEISAEILKYLGN